MRKSFDAEFMAKVVLSPTTNVPKMLKLSDSTKTR